MHDRHARPRVNLAVPVFGACVGASYVAVVGFGANVVGLSDLFEYVDGFRCFHCVVGWRWLALDLAQCPIFDSKGIIHKQLMPLRFAVVCLYPAVKLLACLK